MAIKSLALSKLKIATVNRDGVPLVDSRLIASQLGIGHNGFIQTIRKYEHKIEQLFGAIQYEIRKHSSQRCTEKRALLTEGQAKFLLSNSRNGLDLDAINKFKQLGFDFSSFERVASQRKGNESNYSNDLAKQLSGQREVKTIAGNIDILTSSEIIEVKSVKQWKSALGQILVYGSYYPSHQKRVHLYGETQQSFLDMIECHCSQFDIIVTWEA
jgi:hypothetical protein